MTGPSILVTGGAGYIGSHVVKQLGTMNERVVVLDNLYSGFRQSVLHGELIIGDTGDTELVDRILSQHKVETILHFAAHTVVPESVENPMKYYHNNTCSTQNLLACAQRNGVKHFIFSSTAAVYGMPDSGIASEDFPTKPINPYGTSKLMSEWMLRDLCAASELNSVVLRYFNVAGSDPEQQIGQSTPQATLLTKVACEAALGIRPHVSIYGTDYPTSDGTGVRDYIHVSDLADAHIQALRYLRDGGQSTTVNAGYGHGYSVREVLDTLGKVNDKPLNIIEEPRRAGDPPMLVAANDKIQQTLHWQPKYDDLEFIVKTSLNWEKKLLKAAS